MNLLYLVHLSDSLSLNDTTSVDASGRYAVDKVKVIEALNTTHKDVELDIIVDLLEERLENLRFNRGLSR